LKSIVNNLLNIEKQAIILKTINFPKKLNGIEKVRLTAYLQKAISFLSALNFKLMLLDLNILEKKRSTNKGV